MNTPDNCYLDKGHDAHDLMAPGESCKACGFVAPSPSQGGYMSNDLVVIAHNANEMQAAQVELATWADAKMRETQTLEREAEDGLDAAVRNGWRTKPLEHSLGLLKKQREFYHKIAAAVRLGYVIVPNFPADVFAIRTTRRAP